MGAPALQMGAPPPVPENSEFKIKDFKISI